MRQRLFELKGYLSHWLNKTDQFSIQGPFLSELYRNLRHFLEENRFGNPEIEAKRRLLLANHKTIEVLDFGAGSKKVNHRERKISAITKYSTSGPKFCQIYQFFAAQTNANLVIELGTCMGLSAMYLSKVTKGQIYSFEGSPEIGKVAYETWGDSEINLVTGKISDTLPDFLHDQQMIDFALIDANHTYEGTLENFELILPKLGKKSIVAIADIHWSKGMEKAWKEICQRPEIKISLDFYEAGILFFDSPNQNSEHLILTI